MNTPNLYALDMDNLLRAVNPQTDLEITLYDRLHEAHTDLTIYRKAISEYSELGSADEYPELLDDALYAWWSDRSNLKERVLELEARIEELEGQL